MTAIERAKMEGASKSIALTMSYLEALGAPRPLGRTSRANLEKQIRSFRRLARKKKV